MLFYIWAIGLIIVGLGGIIATSGQEPGLWGCLIAGAVMWYITWYVRNGNRCPHCDKPHGPKKIHERILNRSDAYTDEGSDGKLHRYEDQTVEISYRCKYCGEEWEEEIERKKQLGR